MDAAWVWGLVIIGGPIVLGLALAITKLRKVPATQDRDPDTPSDDPSKGMPGHD